MENLIDPNLNLKDKDTFQNETGVLLTDVKFGVLLGAARNAITNFKKNDVNEKRTDRIQDFCMRIKKGSKKFRKILTNVGGVGVSGNMQRYADLTDVIINQENSEKLNSLWGNSYLCNHTRTFLFKLHNNLLGLNSRVAHFVRGHPRTCTFCDLRLNPEHNPESTVHLFFECNYVETALREFFGWFFGQDTQIGRREFFVGYNFDNINKNKVLDHVLIIVKKSIWDCKLRFCVPTSEILKQSFFSSYSTLYKGSSKIREMTRKSDLFLKHRDIRF
jgi:hypothetical protein